MIRVSVIVPVYRAEAYIARCARSILGQTYPHTQFIFVDDGSPDGSVEILNELIDKEFPGKKERILVLRGENGGALKARLDGLARAEGDYILFVDADDWLEPDAVGSLAAEAEESGADIVFYDFWKEYPSRSKLDRERDYTAATRKEYMKGLYTYRAYGYLWNKFTRRSLFDGVFAPKYNMHEDIILSNQLLFKASSIVHLPKPLYHYWRSNPASLTRVALKKRRGMSARNFLDYYEHFKPALAGSPVEGFTDEILLRAAWIGFTLDRSLFEERPYLKAEARAVPLTRGCFVGLFKQLILKAFLAL